MGNHSLVDAVEETESTCKSSDIFLKRAMCRAVCFALTTHAKTPSRSSPNQSIYYSGCVRVRVQADTRRDFLVRPRLRMGLTFRKGKQHHGGAYSNSTQVAH